SVPQRLQASPAPADLPPFALPCLRCLFERCRFERFRRIAGHGVKSPCELSRLCIVSRDVAAHTKFRAAIADDHLALDHAGRTGNGVHLRLIYRDNGPDELPRRSIKRSQPSIERADVNVAFVEGYAAVDCIAAGFGAVPMRDLRIPFPKLFP